MGSKQDWVFSEKHMIHWTWTTKAARLQPLCQRLCGFLWTIAAAEHADVISFTIWSHWMSEQDVWYHCKAEKLHFTRVFKAYGLDKMSRSLRVNRFGHFSTWESNILWSLPLQLWGFTAFSLLYPFKLNTLRFWTDRHTKQEISRHQIIRLFTIFWHERKMTGRESNRQINRWWKRSSQRRGLSFSAAVKVIVV